MQIRRNKPNWRDFTMTDHIESEKTLEDMPIKYMKKEKIITRSNIVKLLNLDHSYVKNLYNIWDITDASTIGLARILLIQEIQKEIISKKTEYNGQYDDLLASLDNDYRT